MKRAFLALALALGSFAALHTPASAAEVHYSFLVPPNGNVCFPFPVVQAPVHVMVSESAFNNGTQTPSELVSAIVNQDPHSTQMTWLGTNSDGTTKGSTSLSGPIIANFWGGSAPTVVARLHVCSLANRTIGIFQSGGTTSLSGHYFVTMLY